MYGDILSTARSPAQGDINIAADLFYPSESGVTLSGLGIRYAGTAIECVGNCGPVLSTTVTNCALYDCGTGVYTINQNVNVLSSFVCGVTTPITKTSGCYNSVSGGFSQGAAPTITTQPAGQSVVQGANVTFSVTASGWGPLSYQWTFNGAAIPGETQSTYTISGVQSSDAGTYAVAVSDVLGSTRSAGAVLTINGPVTLYGLTDGQNVGGVLGLSAQAVQPSGQLALLTLEADGFPINSSIHVAPFEAPYPQMVFDTTGLDQRLAQHLAPRHLGRYDQPRRCRRGLVSRGFGGRL